MNLLRAIFTSQPNSRGFDTFGYVHILILIITFMGCFFIIANRKRIREDNSISRKVKNTIIIVMIMQQAILYLWYIFSGYNTLTQGLPLYNCRLAIIALAIGLLINNKALKTLGVYWGSFGAIFALILPGVDPFRFPHYTQISYFVGHVFLLWAIAYVLVIENFKYTAKSLKRILIFTTIYHSIVFFINIYLGANYCYLIQPPIPIFRGMSQVEYTLTCIIVFNIIISISYKVCKKLLYTINKKDELNNDEELIELKKLTT
ncbi:hypothetical protein JCM1393_05350 [Clostridium carnis]